MQAAHATAPLTITVQLHAFTVVFILCVIALAAVGAASVWQWFARPRCSCPLCEGQYELVRRLGAGGFGMVFLLIKPLPDDAPGAGANPTTGGLPLHLPAGENRERFVLKLIPVADLAEASTAQIEARDLRALRHPGVVHYHEDFIHFTRRSVHVPAQMYVAIVMEHCEMDARTFVTRVAARGELVPQHVCVNIAAQLVRAVAYCHAQNVVHRDIKSQNVFLTRDGSVRLGDFGLAREVQQHMTSHTDAGTDCYKPPEALTGSRRDARAGDVWGVGLFLLELLSRRFMWQRDEILAASVLQRGRRAVKDIMAQLPPKVYGYELLLLVKECLHPNPSAQELAQRPVLQAGNAGVASRALGDSTGHAEERLHQAPWQTVAPKRRGRRSNHRAVDEAPLSSSSNSDQESCDAADSGHGALSATAVGSVAARQPWIRRDGTLDLSALTPEDSLPGSDGASSQDSRSGSDSPGSQSRHGSDMSDGASHDDAPVPSSAPCAALDRSARGARRQSAPLTPIDDGAAHLTPELGTGTDSSGGWQRVKRSGPRRRKR